MMTNRPREQITKPVFVLLLLMFSIAYNNHFRGIQALWLGVSALVIVVLGVKSLGVRMVWGRRPAFILPTRWTIKHMAEWTVLSKWMLAFYGFSLLSLLWAIERTLPNSMKTMALMFITLGILSNLIVTRQDLERLLAVNYIALILCGVYILATVDRSQLGNVRINSGMEGLWNSNDISVKMCLGSQMALYYLKTCKPRPLKLLHMGCLILFVIIVLYSGSRTGFLQLFIAITLYLLFFARGIKKVSAILGIVCIVVIGYYALMHYQPLYNVLGSRLEAATAGLFGEGTREGSFNKRMQMITGGLQWFLDRPILGYGIGKFSLLYGQEYGIELYAHNNYIEILISLGTIGFILYYIIYYDTLKQLWRAVRMRRDPLAICIIVMNISRLISQLSSVSYYRLDAYIMLLFASIYFESARRETETTRLRNKPQIRSGTGVLHG